MVSENPFSRSDGAEANPNEITAQIRNTLIKIADEAGATQTLAELWKKRGKHDVKMGYDGKHSLEQSQQLSLGVSNLSEEHAYFQNLYNTSMETCTDQEDCPDGFSCVGGFCTLNADSGLVDQGECRFEMPDPEPAETCFDENGCEIITCGQAVDGKPNCCGGEVYTTRKRLGVDDNGDVIYSEPEYSCEKPEAWGRECSVQADQYYKTFGEAASWDTDGLYCEDCQLCSASGLGTPRCQDWGTILGALDDPPCFCQGQEDQCANEEGPCFSCNTETGTCVEDCADCVETCDTVFYCPCDRKPNKTRYSVQGRTDPCSGTSCYDYLANQKEIICATEHPCGPERIDSVPCTKGCEPILIEQVPCPDNVCFNQALIDANCPDGKICHYVDQYLTIGSDGYLTGYGDMFMNICDPIPDCGCAAKGPTYPHFVQCQEPCEECVSQFTGQPASPETIVAKNDFGVCALKPECQEDPDDEAKGFREFIFFFALDYWYVYKAGDYCGPNWYRYDTTTFMRQTFSTSIWSRKTPRWELVEDLVDVRQDVGCNYDRKIGYPLWEYHCPGFQSNEPPFLWGVTKFNEDGTSTYEPYYFTTVDTRVGCADDYPYKRRSLWDRTAGPWGMYEKDEAPQNPGTIILRYPGLPDWYYG